METSTSKMCSNKAIEAADRVMEAYGQDGINLICGDEYTESSDRCETVIGQVPSFNKPLRSKAFLLGIADLLESLE